MKFTYMGMDYYLEFQRHHRKVEVYQKGQKIEKESTYPSTTVRLILRPPTGGKITHKTATANCSHKDKFSLEQGRIQALRLLTEKMTPELKKAVWDCYTQRPRVAGVKKVRDAQGVVVPPTDRPSVGADVPGGGANP